MAATKEKTWEMLKNEGESLSRYEREEVMGGFNIERQSELLNQYGNSFFDSVLQILAKKDREYSKDFCEYLGPSYLDEATVISKIEELIPKIPEDRFEIVRGFKEHVDYLKKFKAGKECSRKYIETLGLL